VNRERFVADREARWTELDQLVRQAGRRASKLGPDGVRRLGALYRATSADLALARRRFPGESVVGRLEQLVVRARGLVYEGNRRGDSFVHFVTTGYWRRVRERPWLLLASVVLMMAPWVLSSTWAVRDPGAAQGLVPAQFKTVVGRDRANFGLTADEKAAASSAIFTNNIRVAFLAFAFGIAAAVGSAVVLVYQGVMLGTVFGLTIDAGNGRALFEFAFPHGVLELTCIVVAGAAGMRMGWALVAPGRRRRRDALVAEARPAAEMALGTAACLVVAGIVEGSLSTSGIGLGPAIAFGCALGGAFWALVVWRGRPERHESGLHDPQGGEPRAELRAAPATSP
jgi:uncharacterized membrane protein SpoIIM required for sporulation